MQNIELKDATYLISWRHAWRQIWGTAVLLSPPGSIVTKICDRSHQSSNLGHTGQCMQQREKEQKSNKTGKLFFLEIHFGEWKWLDRIKNTKHLKGLFTHCTVMTTCFLWFRNCGSWDQDEYEHHLILSIFVQ